ncbi:hypothetical protein [Granulicella sp. L60]|uniref:hypothetical protein n=1 Tax=Granulicella sp. L60 TaxID=1641866 RepID=UPI00131D7502|nr:hypothetical protein [Granulicella sp. L60]
MLARRQSLIIGLVVVSIFVTSCKKPEPQGYRVVAYDGRTKEWTIIDSDIDSETNKTHRKKLIVVCKSYKLGDHDFLKGSDVCDLQVGQLISTFIPKKDADREHVFIDASDNQLYIARGDGDQKIVQFFDILKYEMLPDEK